MSTKSCHVCGASNPQNAKFCSNCSTAFDVQAPLHTDPSPAPALSRVQSTPSFRPAASAPVVKRSLDPNRIRGKVRGFQRDSVNLGSGLTITTWSFMVEEYDSTGNIVDAVQVQMEAQRFSGAIGDGDEVEINAKRSGQGPLNVNEFYNVSRRTMITTRGRVSIANRVGVAMWIVVLLVAAGVFANQVLKIQIPGLSAMMTQSAPKTDTRLSNCDITVTNGFFVDVFSQASWDSSRMQDDVPTGTYYSSDLRRENNGTIFYRVISDAGQGWIQNSMGITVSGNC